MPDVRMPNGTIIKNVPEGTTQSELMARFQKFQQMSPQQPVADQALDRAIDSAPPKSDPGLVGRLVGRALGTDVDDPLELERMGTTIGGAITGASLGSRTPPLNPAINPITGTIVGGIAGAVAGAAAPESVIEGAEFVGAVPEGTREEVGLSNENLRRVVEGEALLELATGGTAAGLRASARAGSRLMSGVGKAETELADRAAEQGVDMAPFQAGKGRLGKGVINVMGRFPLVGAPAQRQGQRVSDQVARLMSDAPERIAPLLSSSELGVRIYDDARTLVKEVGGIFNRQYTDLFEQASRQGVTVNPKGTLETAQETLRRIADETPTAADGQVMTPPRAERAVQAFLDEEILGVADTQTLRQMDNLISKIDQEIASAPQEIRRHVARLLAPIRGAAKSDVTTNVSGEGAQEIGGRLASLDANFARTMSGLFETSTAKRIGSVRRQGLRGTTRPSDEAMRTPVDKLLPIVRDLESPQAIDELSRLVGAGTMRSIASRTVSDAFESAIRETPDGFIQLNPDALARQFGLTGRGSKDKAMERLLRNSPVRMQDIKTIVEASRKIADAPIPSASTFVARRAVLGGARSAGRALVPTTLLGKGAAGALGGLLFFGGVRGLTSALSNPVSARSLGTVLSEEANLVARRANFLRLSRAGLNAMQEAGEITKDQANELFRSAQATSRELFSQEPAREQTERQDRERIAAQGQ